MGKVPSDQPLVCEREVSGAWIVLWCLVGIAAVFAAGFSLGPVVLGSTALGPAVPPALREEVRFLSEADVMMKFFGNRWDRLEAAAKRLGWDQAELDKAMRLVEAAKARFEAVEIARLGLGHDPRITVELLKRELGLLAEQLALTFCEEFHLPCIRGRAPDKLEPLSAPATRPPLRGAFFLPVARIISSASATRRFAV